MVDVDDDSMLISCRPEDGPIQIALFISTICYHHRERLLVILATVRSCDPHYTMVTTTSTTIQTQFGPTGPHDECTLNIDLWLL